MLIHLDKDDVLLICEQATESFEAEDEGEGFTEEVIKRLENADIEVIESRSGSAADEFFVELFLQWDGADVVDVLDLMVEALSNIDIEFTHDEVDLDADDDDEEFDSDFDDDDFDDDDDDANSDEFDGETE